MVCMILLILYLPKEWSKSSVGSSDRALQARLAEQHTKSVPFSRSDHTSACGPGHLSVMDGNDEKPVSEDGTMYDKTWGKLFASLGLNPENPLQTPELKAA